MRITSHELSKHAYRKVKQMIRSKKLLPGEKIVQEQLADKLGISRTPLRAALQMLEAESLIESIPRKGVIVRKFSTQEAIEIYDCRIALECTAVRLFSQKATQLEIDSLRNLLKPFVKSQIDTKAYQVADSLFHDTIIKNCGNHFLYSLFQKGNLLVCIDLIGLIRPPQDTVQEHFDIVSEIEKRDADAAERYMKEHLEKSKRLLLKIIENGR